MGKRKDAMAPLVSVHIGRRSYEQLMVFKGHLESLSGKHVTVGKAAEALIWSVTR